MERIVIKILKRVIIEFADSPGFSKLQILKWLEGEGLSVIFSPTNRYFLWNEILTLSEEAKQLNFVVFSVPKIKAFFKGDAEFLEKLNKKLGAKK